MKKWCINCEDYKYSWHDVRGYGGEEKCWDCSEYTLIPLSSYSEVVTDYISPFHCFSVGDYFASSPLVPFLLPSFSKCIFSGLEALIKIYF